MNTTNRPTMTEQKVTIYFEGGFGFSKIEARSFSAFLTAYAQYSSAVECHFVAKGARKARGFVQTYKPTLVILAGWNHFEPGEKFTAPVDTGNGVSISRGRFSACSPEWSKEFDAQLAAYVAATGAKILADFRGHNPYDAPATAA